MEIGKNNRIEQTPIHDLNLPANPHGYWLFGSLDFQSGNMISSQPRYDHFDTAAYKDPALLIKYQITECKSSVYGKVLSKTPSGIGGFFGGQTGEQQDRPGTADKCGGALYFMPVVVV